MDWLNIIYLVASAILGIIATGVPFAIKVRKIVTAYKEASTEAQREKANADLVATAKQFIASAEITFDGFDRMMKSQNSSAGAMKKDTVFSKLQAYALQNGYEFDTTEWSEKIDELVKFTKDVNHK